MGKAVFTVRLRGNMQTVNTYVDQPLSADSDTDSYRLDTITSLIDDAVQNILTGVDSADIYVSSEYLEDSDTSNKIWR